jgi:Methyltransferase domain
MKRLRPIAKSILPAPLVRRLRRHLSRRRCSKVLDLWAHSESVLSGKPVDPRGEPTPWFTYAAIAFLSQFDYSEKAVFEWGAGASTLFWSRRARHLVSVEHDRDWIERVRAAQPETDVRLLHETNARRYCLAVEREGRQFDVISVDGLFRADCAQLAAKYLAPGGIIVFDNAEEFISTCHSLRGRGFVQIDFSGFGPVRDSPWTTSIFLRGQFSFHPRGDRQPQPVPGSASVQLDTDPRLGSAGIASGA